MVQIAGFGIDLRELQLIGVAIILITSVVNVIIFQESEGFIPVLDKRIIGYPECNANISNPLNQNLTVTSLCIAPSNAELSSLSSSFSFSRFNTTKNGIDAITDLGTAVISIFTVFFLVIKLFLTFELILGIGTVIMKTFELLKTFGLF